METKVNVTSENGTITILEGLALDAKAPIKIDIKGCIDSARLFVEKRKPLNESCHVIINREKMNITLILDESDGYKKGSVLGSLEINPDFAAFGINSGKSWTSFELSDFIKMNRSAFESKEIAMKLVKDLREFKAKIDKEIELSRDDRANFSLKRNQAVNSNLPDNFTITLQILKGFPKETILVEVNINPETLNCILCSPDCADYIAQKRDGIIDSEKDGILKADAGMLIIEQ